MNRVGIKIEDDKPKFFLVEKKEAEEKKIIHLTVFNMILVGENQVLLFRVSKNCEFKNFWSFIAGHAKSLEEAENPVLAAVRETREEAGLELEEQKMFVLGKNEILPAKNYKIKTEDLISEWEISKKYGHYVQPPHLVLPFICLIKNVPKIKLSNELDTYQIVDVTKTRGYNLTPVSLAMMKRLAETT
jgi:8-oxo-dGTP pyrophosphatase MutT (NUDIX family)